MNTLNELHHYDVLCETINIGATRAVQRLGKFITETSPYSTQQEIPFSVQNAELIQLADVSPSTLLLDNDVFGVVTQEFTNDMNAKAMLLFSEESILFIMRQIMGEELDDEMLQELEDETLCELGNIMINACISSLADAVGKPIPSSLPQCEHKSCAELVNMIKKSENVVVTSHIALSINERHSTKGEIFFLMNSDTLESITNALRN